MTFVYTVMGIAFVLMLLAVNAKKLNELNEKYLISRGKK
jgi:hypothetical protein